MDDVIFEQICIFFRTYRDISVSSEKNADLFKNYIIHEKGDSKSSRSIRELAGHAGKAWHWKPRGPGFEPRSRLLGFSLDKKINPLLPTNAALYNS